MTKELKEFIIEGSKEYIEKDCCVTIETSLHKDSICEVFDFIDENIELPENEVWVANECGVCIEYHGVEYCHLSIENEKWISFDKYSTINPNDIIRKSK